MSSGMKLEVMESKFVCTHEQTFDELFDAGKFDTLHAITYSSTFDIVYELASRFNYAEIIFGCSKVLNGKISAALASQTVTVRLLKANKHFDELMQMIKDGHLSLYLLKGRVSHEKLYCLSGDNAAVRVITGSVNMSAPAMTGRQSEGIILYDDDQGAYDAFLEHFLRDKQDSTTEYEPDIINKDNLADASIQEAPLFGVVENIP